MPLILDGYLPRAEAARYLGIAMQTFDNQARTADFPLPEHTGRTPYWKIQNLDAWRARHPARRKLRTEQGTRQIDVDYASVDCVVASRDAPAGDHADPAAAEETGERGSAISQRIHEVDVREWRAAVLGAADQYYELGHAAECSAVEADQLGNRPVAQREWVRAQLWRDVYVVLCVLVAQLDPQPGAAGSPARPW